MDSIDIVDIHARAGFLSRQNEYQLVAHQLWHLSQLEEIHKLISLDIIEHGQKRRISTFFDGTSIFLESVSNDLSEIKKIIVNELQKQDEQKQKMNRVFDNVIKDGNRKIDIEFNKLFSQLQQRICSFVDNSVGSNKAEAELNQLIREYQEKLRTTAQKLFKEIQADLKGQLKELEQEQMYDSTAFNFDFNMRRFEQGKTGEHLKKFSLLLGGVATAAFIAANWWNPAGWVVGAGWIATGLGAIAGFFSGKVRNNEKREFEQKRQNLKNQLINEASKIQRDATQKCKEEITERLNTTKKEVLNSLDPVIDCFTKIQNNITRSRGKVLELIQGLKAKQNKMQKI